mmetsp:Transcript_9492/g.24372  ORF Transcript_9492/g.24372 Transcript_9492/m.24372 type:complete len:318 (-) Transcript_9492:83-1036(-)
MSRKGMSGHIASLRQSCCRIINCRCVLMDPQGNTGEEWKDFTYREHVRSFVRLQREAESIKQTAKTVSKTFSDSVKKYKKAVADSEQDVFFVFIEFNPDTADIFDKLEIQSFPSLVLIPKNFRIDFAESSFHVGAELRPNVANKEAFDEFLDTFLGLEIFTAEKEEPSVSFFNIILAYFTIVLIGRMLWTISKNDMLVPLMAVGSIGVYWLSTSGIIKCIIHGLPMVTYDHDRKPRVFVHDSKNQTILEGFTISTCYVLIAICLSTFTFVLPYVKNQNIKQLGLYTTFVFGILAYFFTMEAFQWKTYMRTLIYGFNL